MGFGGGGFFFLGFLPMPICEEGREVNAASGIEGRPAGNAGPSKNPRENRVDDRGTRVPGRAFRVPTARRARWDDGDGHFQEAASITRGASRCASHAPRALCVRCRRRCPTASAAAGTPRPWARAREPSARTTRPRSTEPSGAGRNRGRWRGRIRPKPRPPSCVCAAECAKRGSTTTEAAPTQMFLEVSRLGARDPLAARLGKPSRFREPLARTP